MAGRQEQLDRQLAPFGTRASALCLLQPRSTWENCVLALLHASGSFFELNAFSLLKFFPAARCCGRSLRLFNTGKESWLPWFGAAAGLEARDLKMLSLLP